jgi:PAS domain S-box-containing protein
MKRDATGRFTSNWDFEAKRRVSVTLTNTAWQLLEEEAQQYGISRSEVIERTARSFATVKKQPGAAIHPSLEEMNTLRQRLLELEQSNRQCQEHVSFLTQQLNQERDARQQAEDRLHLTLTAAQVVAWDMDLTANRVVCSSNAQDLWGIQAGTAKDFFAVIHPDDRQQVIQAAERAIAGETGYLQEYRVIGPDGATRWLRSQGQAFLNDVGQGVRMIGLSVDITERKQAEAALREREEQLRIANERFQLAAKAVNCLIYDWYLEPDRVERTDGLTRILGYSLEDAEPTGKWWRDRIHPDDLPPIEERALVSLRTDDYFTCEYRILNKSNEYVYVLDQCLVVKRNASGNPTRIVGSTTNISEHKRIETERKQAELKLQESQQFIQQIANSMLDTLYVYDMLERRNVYVNRQIGELLGYTPEQIQVFGDQLFPQLMHPEDFANLGVQIERLNYAQDGEVVDHEYRMRDANGEWRWLWSRNTVSTRTADGQAHQVVGTVYDITNRKRAEAELQQREQEFRTLVENTPDIIVRYDRDLHHLYINPSIEQAVGVPPEQFIGKTGIELGFTDERSQTWYATVQHVFKTGQSYSFEYEFPKPDGELRFYQTRFVPELVEGDYVKTVVGVARDVTEYKRAEISLRESEQRLQLAQQAGRIGTWEWNLLTNDVSWSDGIWTLLALEPNSITPNLEAFTHFIHPDDRAQAFERVEAALAQGDDYYDEFRVVRQDGVVCWLLSKGRVIRTADGQQERLLGINIDITDRKRAEAALAESNQTLQAIIQASPLAIMGLRSDGAVQIWNPAAERIFGWTQDEVLGKFLPAIPDNKRDEFLNNLAITMQGQGLVGVETQRQKKGNTLFDVELWSAPVDETQAGISCVWMIADITARKRTEAALRLSEERLHGFVSANVIGILYGDFEGGIQDANDEFLRIVGYSREDLQAGRLRWIDITPPEYLPLDAERIAEARRRGACTPFEKEYIRKDGSRVPVLVGFGLVLAVREEAVAFVLDLSDRKQAEESLRQSEERYRYLAESIPQLVWTANAEGVLMDVNQRWCAFTGLTLEDAQTAGWAAVVHPDDVSILGQNWAIAQQNGSYYQAEGRMRRADGVYRWHLHQAVPLKNEQGQLVKWFGTATEIEDQKQLEQQRIQLLQQEQIAREQAETANRIKDEFLAVLSHELRTPLNPILGWARLLRTRQFDIAASDRALETIERNAKLQAQLIEDLLDISRILQGKVKLEASPVNLVPVIEAALETVRLSAEAKGIQIQTVLNCDVALVNGDMNRLQQVVWNLLSNAVKFTPPSGRIDVKLESYKYSGLSSQLDGSTQHSTLSTQHLQSFAQIIVSDTGQGIKPDFLPYVFEYFRQADSSTTRQFGGLGLGLAIVRHLVELHGGAVKAESPGQGMGATFTVQLPLMTSVLTPDLEVFPVHDTKNLNNINILVVDDEADMRDLMKFLLEEQGAAVTVAASAAEALQKLTTWLPDVLISDIGMPEMDGYALMQQIRATLSEEKVIPAIALTAYAGEVNRRQALSAGFQLHLAKPIEPEQLTKSIVQVIAQSFKPSS